jgi:hypothetical protein
VNKPTASISYIRYIELNINNTQYRLLKKPSLFAKIIPFTVNGIPNSAPYNDNFVNVLVIAKKLVLSTNFGLTITWDGSNAATQSLCDAYSPYICGLCGNGDGNIKKKFILFF